MGDVVRILKDLPSAADHFADLQNEISQLQNSANQAALIKYIEQKFQSSAPDSPKALAIAMSGLALAQQALNFYQSIVSLKSIIQS
jgi:nucleoside phosphorylase